MQENTRAHTRIHFNTSQGITFQVSGILPKAVDVYIPEKISKMTKTDLLFHFHGDKSIVAYAAEKYKGNLVAVIINLGSGSGVYATPFNNDSTFEQLKTAVWRSIDSALHHRMNPGKVILSGFSAGYGAVRSILAVPKYVDAVNGVLLLDGMHSSYIPEGKPLAEGGSIDSSTLAPFVNFARLASGVSASKKFLFTHSEICPGTFVSTTECAGFLLKTLQMKATPVLKWGPNGMQQISEAHKGSVTIWGYAGNSAPDHIDHFQSLSYFLNKLL